MADYTIAVLPDNQIAITNGESLGNPSQGDGSHLVGEFITLGTGGLTQLDITDPGFDSNFDDNDSGQRLDGAHNLGGTTYPDNTIVEAEYRLTLRDNATNITYTAIGVNVRNSSPAFTSIEGLSFVGTVPPRGVALEVVSAFEGPGSFGQPPIDSGNFVTCFANGTLIATPEGDRPVEQLGAGDRILTKIHGVKRLSWVGASSFGAHDLAENPKLRPVRIMAGALGDGYPARDLYVSLQHRMLVQSKIAQRMFGQAEVLVPAIKLTDLPGVFVDDTARGLDYFHLLFDQHEIIFAEGTPSESLFIGPEALKAISPQARLEIQTLFPQVSDLDFAPEPACFIPPGKQQRQLIARHVKNHKPLM